MRFAATVAEENPDMSSYKETLIWKTFKGTLADPLRRGASRLRNGGRVPLAYSEIRNWGDALNPVLVELLSGRKVQRLQALFYDRFMVIGSILESATSRAEVWGSGFMHENGRVIETPRAIHAVRGPLTRAALLKAGIDCPEVHGDPALLLPRFFSPDVPKQFDVGIIPHVVDKGNAWVQRHQDASGVVIVDVESDIWEFVRTVKSCRAVLSSSLHGLICADAYGIPNAWLKLSDRVMGSDFKFRDYRLSIGAGEPHPINVGPETDLDGALTEIRENEMRIDLQRLVLACPFLSDELRAEETQAIC